MTISPNPFEPLESHQGQPPWMEIAIEEIGVRSVEPGGTLASPRVQAYLAAIGLSTDGSDLPWCSAFVEWCLNEVGIQGTGLPNARSWLEWPSIPLSSPLYGCVTILWRAHLISWKGHVGFCIGASSKSIILLGGNQDKSVKLKSYDLQRVLGYRWPANHPPPKISA